MNSPSTPDLADKILQRLHNHHLTTAHPAPHLPTFPVLNRNLTSFLHHHLPNIPLSRHRTITTCYRFSTLGDKRYAVPGYTCGFCHAAQFPSQTHLHFHLAQMHPKMSYAIRGPVIGDDGTTVITVEVEESLEILGPVKMEERVFCWRRPRGEVDVGELVRGERVWMKRGFVNIATGELVVVDGQRELDEHDEETSDLSKLPSLASITASLPLPPRLRGPRVPVPHPTNTRPSPLYLRSRSKRFLTSSETLSDSEDDSDTDSSHFLRSKNHDTIDEYADLTAAEKRFAKMWNDHLLVDPCRARCYMPGILERFAERNREVLRPKEEGREGVEGGEGEMWEIWVRHCLLLVQQRVVDAVVLKRMLEVVRGTGT
ncbi:hypothetical protein EX30DRAFT_365272 [Ascodesmis nigricans]|uniref:Polycomb protein VEFS-Box domain-containing protein n=1 Tax=Ascodesmis nigricans TaxID=341454 RepID=A0A4S2MQL4_9PEZI|nr:hypothetical protein EX30DRAFT_365272 [Ascodesmis nigricans]